MKDKQLFVKVQIRVKGDFMYNALTNITMNHIFNAGLYLRLSREDENTQESMSIANQKDFLIRYAMENGWNIKDIYIDDGYSGTNFERPGFTRLIDDITQSKINMVITKDLSRLGRDYIGVGHYLERFFPENKVRYIAVNDGIDTFENSSNNDMTPFRSVINDMYAKDISKKVRTAIDTRRHNGKFIGSFEPYGYRKDPSDNNKLVIDPEAAYVIKRIFKLYLEGTGYNRIAKLLNEDEVPNPSEYKKLYCNYKNNMQKSALWTPQTVRKILINPMYAGNMAQRKYQKVSYKSKKQVAMKPEQWIVVNNTHEPIIDQNVFDAVQENIARQKTTNNISRSEHILSGLIYCGDCGDRLTFNTSKGTQYTVCTRYRKLSRKGCTAHYMREEVLENIVLEDIRKIAKAALKRNEFLELAAEADKKRLQGEFQIVDRLEARMEEIKKALKTVYEDKLKGLLNDERYLELSDGYYLERQQLTEKIAQIKASNDMQKHIEDEQYELICLVDEFLEMSKPTKTILSKLIEKIDLCENAEGKEVKVHYKFKNPF